MKFFLRLLGHARPPQTLHAVTADSQIFCLNMWKHEQKAAHLNTTNVTELNDKTPVMFVRVHFIITLGSISY